MNVINEIMECINDNKSFVLQGGAGSGKTETLKRTLEYVYERFPNKKIACITHTNLAVDEIKSRVGTHYSISTIHSFLNDFIKDYRKNIQQVIHELFLLELIEAQGIELYDDDEKLQKKEEHIRYKRIHDKYDSALFMVKKEHADKVEGKREYDRDPQEFNKSLNDKIEVLNSEILSQIQEKDYNQIRYNETRFNNFQELTYGHDGLLDVTYLLFDKYPILSKILQDKYDYIFIDEYQDTSEKIIKILLDKASKNNEILIGLFGDSMQAIYEDGIGDVEKYICNKKLKRIDKTDNYRCSEQVVSFLNNLRTDGLEQKVAFKEKEDGTEETIDERQGCVSLYYSFYEDKPHARSPSEKKEEYLKALDSLISEASESQNIFRELKLTNKSIANDAGFGKLYELFSKRYADPIEIMDKHLAKLQFTELFELCRAYKPLIGPPNYNFVLSKLKKQGLSIKSIADKVNIKKKFDKITNSKKGALQVLNMAFEYGLLKKSEKHSEYLERKDEILNELSSKSKYKSFKKIYLDGKNTFNRMKKEITNLVEDDFKDFERDIKKELFYNGLTSGDLKFQEIQSYFDYQMENTQYITMHKTKGSGIDNVIVVLDEYFWLSEYDFKTVFSEEGDPAKRRKSQKLIYVACSRAKTNLRCVRLLSNEQEEAEITQYFGTRVKV